MQLEVMAPAMRRDGAQRLIDSLAAQTRRPDAVTLVSNEMVAADLAWHGLNGRVLAFRSEAYAVGERDVALRGNIGIFHGTTSHILIAADDQICPRDGIAAWERALVGKPFAWGHHRLFDGAPDVAALLDRPAETGASRERGVNVWHGYWSAYSGSFGAWRDYLMRAGGFDMLFNGRHAGEDQNLGRRLAHHNRDGLRVFIHEPPFWWHPPFDAPSESWPAPGWANVCPDGAHSWVATPMAKGQLLRCTRCPLWRYDGDDPQQPDPLIRFDPALVTITETRPC